MIDVALLRTGSPVAHVELSTVSVAIVASADAKITCALFFDKEDVRLQKNIISHPRLVIRRYVSTVTFLSLCMAIKTPSCIKYCLLLSPELRVRRLTVSCYCCCAL